MLGRIGPQVCRTTTHISTPSCSFINLAAAFTGRRMEYSESRVVGYTPDQMFSIVSRVDQYPDFIPWCKKSRLLRGHHSSIRVELHVGFPPLLERYTSEITTIPNHQVRAVCCDGSIFSHLETTWRFSPRPEDPQSCKVDFYVSFEFKSVLHSQLASVFFNEVVKTMVSAFESRAAELYPNQREAPLQRHSL
ncbi:coenzyme Q-binding protein COQ10 homolog, mitochondrial [Pholidichthys leucotaenia]